MSDTVTIQVVRQYSSTPERVFEAWLDAPLTGKFLFATTNGKMVHAEVDRRVGGKFAFVDRRDGVDIEHVGEYLEINPPRRLAFTFGVPQFSDQFTQVAIDIDALDCGCELTLTHSGVLSEYASRTEGGWSMILGNLAAALGEKPA